MSDNQSRSSKNRERLDRVEQIAYKLYQNRLLLNRTGDSKGDWIKAETIALKKWRLAAFICNYSFIRLEKRIWEPILNWASNQALISILGLIGNAVIIFTLITYINSEKQRRDAEILNAWQVITSAHGQSGNGGRIRALEFLNTSPGAHWRRKFPWFCAPLPLCTWPKERLTGINLAIPSEELTGEGLNEYGVFLDSIQLPNAQLAWSNLENIRLNWANLKSASFYRANLRGASLYKADLRKVGLSGANLESVSMVEADLRGARSRGANFRNSTLKGADFEDSVLDYANFEDANLDNADFSSFNRRLENATNFTQSNLYYASFEGASLLEANFEGAALFNTNFTNADLTGARFRGAFLLQTNFSGANVSGVYFGEALLCETVLPAEVKIDSDRDCDRIPLGVSGNSPVDQIDLDVLPRKGN